MRKITPVAAWRPKRQPMDLEEAGSKVICGVKVVNIALVSLNFLIQSNLICGFKVQGVPKKIPIFDPILRIDIEKLRGKVIHSFDRGKMELFLCF